MVLQEYVASISKIEDGDDSLYYAITLLADEGGQIVMDMQSIWAGYEDEARRVELREGRLVYADYAKFWIRFGQPFLVVRDEVDFAIFLSLGGNGLVEQSLGDTLIPDWLKPGPSLTVGSRGFVSPSLLDAQAFKKAPTSKLRMAVLNRDRRRCRICGRYPDDDTDLELHVHHIRPWQHGGVTALPNLITLCHTCHTGLEPHYDPSLFSYIEHPESSRSSQFEQGVLRYRQLNSGDLDQAQ